MELLELYRSMVRARAFELLLAELWERGEISGEMHLGTGEEAVAAGTTAHLREGDAVALDHRPTPVMLLLGVEPAAMVREMLGREDGLCGGNGGHMHLFSRPHLAASSGIVGASGPLGAGFALAARSLRPGSVAVSFFGEGAANQGMLLESLNLAAAWRLPQLFVCKDNSWAITTRSPSVTGGDLLRRARAFGLEATAVDGLDVRAVESAAARALDRLRRGKGPVFLLAGVSRLDGHFLGDQMVKAASRPLAEGGEIFKKSLSAALTAGGAGFAERARSLGTMASSLRRVRSERRDGRRDPLRRARKALRRRKKEIAIIDRQVVEEMEAVRAAALATGR